MLSSVQSCLRAPPSRYQWEQLHGRSIMRLHCVGGSLPVVAQHDHQHVARSRSSGAMSTARGSAACERSISGGVAVSALFGTV